MTYRLEWLNYWSKKNKPTDPRVIVRWNEEPDGWWEHENFYYFDAADDKQAKDKARQFVEQYDEPIDVFSVYNRETKQTIMTEEDL